jgi:K+-sensing histidine kinase KdpD
MRKLADTIPRRADGRFAPFRRRRAGPVIRYAAAALCVCGALMLTDWLREYFQGTPNAIFFCAIILSGWYGGFGPGVFSSLLSVLAIKFYIEPPLFSRA